ncbi:1189_t:CDS:2 [Scutellospora calospora]|uniref:1189_t:CDS:1 n=1 Tax=Scutellospora calospora TaxID=85575 RepID=A0ACA9KS80_9GLOM|nr:1189_t:CDS:2 [Scutellospora calospora]
MINDNLLNSNELNLNDTVYFEFEMTISLDYSDTYNNSVPSENDYQDISINEDESDNNKTDDELHLELVVGISFLYWKSFKAWLNCFALQKGFDYKIRTSEADNKGIIRRATYMCTKAGTHSSNITVDPTKRCNTKSQRTKCS